MPILPFLEGGSGRDLAGGAVLVPHPAFADARHVLVVWGRAAPAPGMKRRSRDPHLVLRHFEHFSVQRPAQLTGIMVERRHEHISLHPQGGEAVFLRRAGEIGALGHHQAARLGAGDLKLLGDRRNRPVRAFTPDNHLGELRVHAIYQALLVGPAAVPKCLAVGSPGPG